MVNTLVVLCAGSVIAAFGVCALVRGGALEDRRKREREQRDAWAKRLMAKDLQ